MSPIESLSANTMRHWGLMASPFCVGTTLDDDADPIAGPNTNCDTASPAAPEFYFRSMPHVGLLNWLIHHWRAYPLMLVRSQIGAGVTMAMRQLSQTNGLNQFAADPIAIAWNRQTVERLGDRICQPARRGVRRLVCVHAFRPTQVTQLRLWMQRHIDRVGDTAVLIRIEDHPGTRNSVAGLPSYTLDRTGTSDRQRCVQAALRHAGASAPIFTDRAIERLVHQSDGSFRDLARSTHALLSWTHAHRFDFISDSIVRQFNLYFQKPIEARAQRAAA